MSERDQGQDAARCGERRAATFGGLSELRFQIALEGLGVRFWVEQRSAPDPVGVLELLPVEPGRQMLVLVAGPAAGPSGPHAPLEGQRLTELHALGTAERRIVAVSAGQRRIAPKQDAYRSRPYAKDNRVSAILTQKITIAVAKEFSRSLAEFPFAGVRLGVMPGIERRHVSPHRLVGGRAAMDGKLERADGCLVVGQPQVLGGIFRGDAHRHACRQRNVDQRLIDPLGVQIEADGASRRLHR